MVYLKSNFMGSTLEFGKVIENKGAYVVLNNGEKVAFRNGEYFQRIRNWDNIYYTRFETREECIEYIKENFEQERDFNCVQSLDELLNQESLKL